MIDYTKVSDNQHVIALIKKREKIKKIIDDLRDKAYFGIMEGSPEDFIEGRTDWEDLADSYETLYYALMEIESEVGE